MKSLGDLNELLFRQMERLDQVSTDKEEINAEIKRSKAIEGISKNIIENANVILKAEKFKDDKWNADAKLPKLLEVDGNEA